MSLGWTGWSLLPISLSPASSWFWVRHRHLPFYLLFCPFLYLLSPPRVLVSLLRLLGGLLRLSEPLCWRPRLPIGLWCRRWTPVVWVFSLSRHLSVCICVLLLYRYVFWNRQGFVGFLRGAMFRCSLSQALWYGLFYTLGRLRRLLLIGYTQRRREMPVFCHLFVVNVVEYAPPLIDQGGLQSVDCFDVGFFAAMYEVN